MATSIVGIPACTKFISGYVQHATPARYGAALMAASGATPLLLPPEGPQMLEVLDRLDGIMFNGSPSNVAPMRYGADFDATPDFHDPERDATTLPLIMAALERGMPILCICRGMQELNVAMGGTLHQKLQDLPGRIDHSAPKGDDLDLKMAKAHEVTLTDGGLLHRLAGARHAMVNSLHNQGIDRLGAGLVTEAVAPDGTIEAVRAVGGPGFALGVQWHPEFDCAHDMLSQGIFGRFGDALRGQRGGMVLAAD
jgi:putative glutamine amidotransferase